MIRAVLRPALPATVLLAVAGWMLAGWLVLGSVLVGWPPVASLVLEVPGWDVAVAGTGGALGVGGLLVLLAGVRWPRESTRWALELTGESLLAAGWLAYGVLSLSSGSVGVLPITAGHALAALWRMHEVKQDERQTRARIKGEA